MNLLHAFIIQLQLFFFGGLVHAIRCYFNKDLRLNLFKDFPTWCMVIFIWFGLFTVMRYHFQHQYGAYINI